MIMCTFKIIAVSNWELYQKFHGGNLEEYTEYLAGLAVLGIIRPDILIVREKNLPEKIYLQLFTQLWEKCESRREQGNQVQIIPHTHLAAAKQAGSSKIHLPFPLFEKYQNTAALVSGSNRIVGAKDLSAWPLFGIDKIGVSIHSCKEAKRAEKMGASYLTAGHIFSTDCKMGVPPRGIAFLEEICKSVTIPVYAIGGIHPQNLPLIQRTEAAGACMMSEYMKGQI